MGEYKEMTVRAFTFNASLHKEYISLIRTLGGENTYIVNFTNKGIKLNGSIPEKNLIWLNVNRSDPIFSPVHYKDVSLSDISDITTAKAVYENKEHSFREMRFFLWSSRFLTNDKRVKKPEQTDIGIFRGRCIYGDEELYNWLYPKLLSSGRYFDDGYIHMKLSFDGEKAEILSVERDPKDLTEHQLNSLYSNIESWVNTLAKKKR